MYTQFYLCHEKKRIFHINFVPLFYTAWTLENQESCGSHILNHLTADGTSLAGGEVTVVTLVKIYSYFACCLHLELLKCLLSILVCHNFLLKVRFDMRNGHIHFNLY